MSKPLGRDQLGRLVYMEDAVDDGSKIGIVCGLYKSGHIAIHSPADYWEMDKVQPEATTVILEASPKQTNYARYYADLGTIEEIENASEEICHELEECRQCPFDRWAKIDPYALCKESFKHWLKQEANT